MKTLKERIAYEIWGTNPDNFNAESRADTPYQTDVDTLGNIEDFVNKELDEFKLGIIGELEILAAHYKQYGDHIELQTIQECISKIKLYDNNG